MATYQQNGPFDAFGVPATDGDVYTGGGQGSGGGQAEAARCTGDGGAAPYYPEVHIRAT